MAQPREAYQGLPAPGPAEPALQLADLGHLAPGLVLRRATAADVEALAAFNEVVQAEPPSWSPLPWVAHWTRQLMDGSHPRARAEDFLVVHDTQERRIASTLSLLSHRLRYGAVELSAGMPELVGTHPDYRRLGLVALQFDEIHRRSQARGDQVQIIDGIPWYYRQFGYEMALEQSHGVRVPTASLPSQPAPELRLRDARVEDAAFIAELHEQAARTRYRVSCVRDEAFFRWEIAERHPMAAVSRRLWIAEDGSGARLAAVSHVPILLNGWVWMPFAELAPGVPADRVMPALLHHVREVGVRLEREPTAGGDSFAGASFGLCEQHPLLAGLGGQALARVRPYAWYVRVADLAGFLQAVATELEARLERSPHAGFEGTLALNRYTDGVRLRFKGGRLAEVERWRPSTDERGDAAFPGESFLSLLLGHRSLAQLREAFPDCLLWDEAKGGLVESLFPPQPSFLWPTS